MSGLRLIFILSIFFLVSLTGSVEAATLSVAPATETIATGEDIEIEVIVREAQGLMGFQFDISYDGDILELEEIALSGGISATQLDPIESDLDEGNKAIRIGGYVMTGTILSDNDAHSLVRIRFRGLEEGISNIGLSGGILVGQGAVKMAATYEGGSIRVINPNHAPVLDSIGDKAIKEGKLLEFTVSAQDPDGNELNYTATNLPQGATFKTITQSDESNRGRAGRFSWEPNYEQQGQYNVTFKVTDGELEDEEAITITVIDVPQYNGIIQGKVYGTEYPPKRIWWWYRWWWGYYFRHKPLDGATVTLSGKGIEKVDITTDTTGSYSFNGLSAGGIYRLTASKDGYRPSTRWAWLSRYRDIVRIGFYLRKIK